MTSKLTRERLQEIAEDGFLKHGETKVLARMALSALDSAPHTDDELSNLLWYSQEATCHSDPNYYCEFQRLATPGLIAGITRELQERRKADSEPVAWLLSGGGTKNVVCFDSGNAYADPLREVTPLYRHAQPVTVVPDEVTAEDCPAFVEYEVAEVDEAWSRGFNACRAAMLAAAQHDTPALNSVQNVVTVPGKWIPVSERMPEDDDFVYIWPRPDFGVELHVGQYCERSHKGGGWYAQVYEQNYGIEWRPITVTHWMPLPAAPQEVNRE